jgi:hypothetical protein
MDLFEQLVMSFVMLAQEKGDTNLLVEQGRQRPPRAAI